ncbi:putative PEP-binding protein, partial [Desulfosarcina sp.]|uniref:putative PEP-binding protein n=1 Tax=Desulfosarcina sp. TaxID=2027861 RepID=UPI0029ADC505
GSELGVNYALTVSCYQANAQGEACGSSDSCQLRRKGFEEAGISDLATLDKNGVGELMRIAIQKGRAINPDLECGICGEHGGDPESIALCHELGLTYVSCSPFRVPAARLAAAQAALLDKK